MSILKILLWIVLAIIIMAAIGYLIYTIWLKDSISTLRLIIGISVSAIIIILCLGIAVLSMFIGKNNNKPSITLDPTTF